MGKNGKADDEKLKKKKIEVEEDDIEETVDDEAEEETEDEAEEEIEVAPVKKKLKKAKKLGLKKKQAQDIIGDIEEAKDKGDSSRLDRIEAKLDGLLAQLGDSKNSDDEVENDDDDHEVSTPPPTRKRREFLYWE